MVDQTSGGYYCEKVSRHLRFCHSAQKAEAARLLKFKDADLASKKSLS